MGIHRESVYEYGFSLYGMYGAAGHVYTNRILYFEYRLTDSVPAASERALPRNTREVGPASRVGRRRRPRRTGGRPRRVPNGPTAR